MPVGGTSTLQLVGSGLEITVNGAVTTIPSADLLSQLNITSNEGQITITLDSVQDALVATVHTVALANYSH